MQALVIIALFVVAAQSSISAGPVCVANGREYAQGETACITLPCQTPYLARCGQVLNNSSWKKISDACPSTGRSSPMMRAGLR
jgi:hypothetical protein